MIDSKTQAILVLARTLYDAVLVGNPAPSVARIYRWMTAPPQSGNLVVEISTFHRNSTDGIGRFLKTEERSLCCHEHDSITDVDVEPVVCTSCDDDERCARHAVWIEHLDPPCGNHDHCDNRGCIHRRRWSNCTFIRVPSTPADFREATDTRRT